MRLCRYGKTTCLDADTESTGVEDGREGGEGGRRAREEREGGEGRRERQRERERERERVRDSQGESERVREKERERDTRKGSTQQRSDTQTSRIQASRHVVSKQKNKLFRALSAAELHLPDLVSQDEISNLIQAAVDSCPENPNVAKLRIIPLTTYKGRYSDLEYTPQLRQFGLWGWNSCHALETSMPSGGATHLRTLSQVNPSI